MKYENETPQELRRGVTVNTVGDLVAFLNQLPSDMKMARFRNEKVVASVVEQIQGDKRRLAVSVEVEDD